MFIVNLTIVAVRIRRSFKTMKSAGKTIHITIMMTYLERNGGENVEAIDSFNYYQYAII